MRFWAWLILGISGACIGFFIYWLLLFISLGWDDCDREYFYYIGLPPLLIATFGASFLYARRRLLTESDGQFWVALALYAVFGAYLLWLIYVMVLGFGS